MLTAFTLCSVLAVFSVVDSVYAENLNQNETATNENDNDFADSSASLARNITANFSVSDSDVGERDLSVSVEKLLHTNGSITDRSGLQDLILSNPKLENAVEFNTNKNTTAKSKKLEDFRPSPQLETFYEYNTFSVKPALPEPKMVRNYANINSEDNFAIGDASPPETDRQTSRNLNNFEPGFSAFGTSNFPNPGRSQNALSRNTGDANNNINNVPSWNPQPAINNEVNRKNENGDTPWVSRVRFPQNPIPNDNPYAFVSSTATHQNCCQEKAGPITSYAPSNTYNNNGQSPPKNNEYLPPLGGANRTPLLVNKHDDAPRNHYNNINTNKVGYAPPSPGYGFTGGDNGESTNGYSPPSYGSSGGNEEFNFNKLVETPKTYYQGPPNRYSPHHTSYEPSYNLMEKPSSEGQQKTYGGGMIPLKKILKLFAAFIPIGLLISALTPTVITVTNVNDTSSDMAGSRYRSEDSPKKDLTNRVSSSLDYFDKLNENGCEYRVFCELLVSASHMPNSKQHVENLLDNFAKEEVDYKSRAEELKKVFAAVRNHDCTSISCKFIKNPT